MATSVFFNWPSAKRVGIQGQKVRRNGWAATWWKYQGGLWWCLVDGAAPRVVRNTDYTRADLRALDWTNMPPGCATAALAKEGSACPAAVDLAAVETVSSAVSSAVSSERYWPLDFPSGVGDPPALMAPGGDESGSRKASRPLPLLEGPRVAFQGLADTRVGCYEGTCSDRQTTTISGEVRVTEGPSSMVVSIHRAGYGLVAHGSLWRGGGVFGWADLVEGHPGYLCRYTATVWAPGMADSKATASIAMQGCSDWSAWSDWSPAAEAVCAGDSATQTRSRWDKNGCSSPETETRTVEGTRECPCREATAPTGDNVFQISEAEFLAYVAGGTWSIACTQQINETIDDGWSSGSGSGVVTGAASGCSHTVKGPIPCRVEWSDAAPADYTAPVTLKAEFAALVSPSGNPVYYASFTGSFWEVEFGAYRAGQRVAYPYPPTRSISVDGNPLTSYGTWNPTWSSNTNYVNTSSVTVEATFTPAAVAP